MRQQHDLARLEDERARAVLRAAADATGWGLRTDTADTGLGLGYARYKNTGAYCAAAAEVEAGQAARHWARANARRARSPGLPGTASSLPSGVRVRTLPLTEENVVRAIG
jgi:hypothetical protein